MLFRSVTGDVTNIGTSATYCNPVGLALDRTWTYVYVADTFNNLVRKINIASGDVINVGTSAANPGWHWPHAVAVDGNNNVFVADAMNNLIRRIDGVTGYVTNIGTSASPAINNPTGLTVDLSGSFVYVANYGNNVIQQIELATGIVNKIGTSVSYTYPKGLDVDSAGNVYEADAGSNQVRMITVSAPTAAPTSRS